MTSDEASAEAVVSDGQYTVVRERGLLPGNYRVKIAAVRLRIHVDEPPSLLGGGGSRPQEQPDIVPIPPKYNVNTVLTAEVKAEGQQTIDFDLD